MERTKKTEVRYKNVKSAMYSKRASEKTALDDLMMR